MDFSTKSSATGTTKTINSGTASAMDPGIEKRLRADLKVHAKALDIPPGAAHDFIDLTIKAVKKSLKSKSTITERDLTRLVAKELKKYHADLAYIYQNYDTII